MPAPRLILPPSATGPAQQPPPAGFTINVGVHGDQVIISTINTVYFDPQQAAELADALRAAADRARGVAVPGAPFVGAAAVGAAAHPNGN